MEQLGADTATMPPDLSLRERKKEVTRRALHEAALRLTIERGLDAVTVEAIADEANVSRRTFSNYFANKEEAVLYRDQVRIAALLDAVRARPADEPPWRALSEGARSEYADLDTLDPRWMAQLRLIRRHPAVLARQLAAQAAFELDLAAEIANRLPESTMDRARTARIMAAAFQSTLRTVFSVWIEEHGSTSLSDAIRTGLDTTGRGFS